MLLLTAYTITDPLVTWTRFSFPVLVLAPIVSPLALTTFVALRAIFGPARALIQQFSRIASVEYFNLRMGGQLRRAEALLTAFLFAGSFFGSALATLLLADNGRLLALWNPHLERNSFQIFVASFALAIPLMSSQIIVGLKTRRGDLRDIASIHYLYLAASAIFGALALAFKDAGFYAASLCVVEMAVSVLFFWRAQRRSDDSYGQVTKRGLSFAAVLSSPVFFLLVLLHLTPLHLFFSSSALAVTSSLVLAATLVSSSALVAVILDFPQARNWLARLVLQERSATAFGTAGAE